MIYRYVAEFTLRSAAFSKSQQTTDSPGSASVSGGCYGWLALTFRMLFGPA